MTDINYATKTTSGSNEPSSSGTTEVTVVGPVSTSGLTDTELRATSVPVSDGGSSLTVDGTFWQATQPVSGTFWQATQPVSVASAIPVYQGDAQLTSYTQAGVIAINTVLATLDLLNYGSVLLQCVSMGTTGVVTPEFSNDNATWVGSQLYTPAGNNVTTFNAAGLWFIPRRARYLRLRLSTATTAGTTTLSIYRVWDDNQPFLGTQPVSGSLTSAGTTTATPATPTASILNSAATTNGTVVKASAGTLYSISASNINAAVRYLKIYNSTSVTVGTTTPAITLAIPATGFISVQFGAMGMRFGTGICIGLTTGATDADTGAVAANELKVLTSYI